MRLGLGALFIAFFWSGGWCLEAAAQDMRVISNAWRDCAPLLKSYKASGMVGWRDTVEVEHCDRINRLNRIARLQSGASPPLFFDGTVVANKLPSSIGVELPILRVVFPERVFFDTDSSRLRPEAWDVVQIIAESLRHEPPDVVLFVAGHADERGGDDYNFNLSIDRANALAEGILDFGVNVASVWRVGFGEDMPLASGHDEAAWAQNRRIEFLFAARPEAVAVWMADNQVDLRCQGRTQSETDRCRASVALKAKYTAVKIQSLPKEVLNPGRPRVGVEVSGKPTVINPVGTQKIDIYPVNRKAGPVEVN